MMAVLLVHAAATWMMVGVIWMVQIVHYPLFAAVGEDRMPAYERSHQTRITLIVGPAMLIEALMAATLLALRPAGIPASWLWLGGALVLVNWLATALLAVPQHEKLAIAFDSAAHRFLVLSNWVRTVAWTVRGVLALAMLQAAAMRAQTV